MRGGVTDAGRTTTERTLKIELLSQWKMEAEFRNFWVRCASGNVLFLWPRFVEKYLSIFFLVGVGGPKGISRNDPILQGSNDLSCSLCKTVMELVDQAITDEANEQAVIFYDDSNDDYDDDGDDDVGDVDDLFRWRMLLPKLAHFSPPRLTSSARPWLRCRS